MKKSLPKQRAKRPKAKLMWATYALGYGNLSCVYNKTFTDDMTDAILPVAVIPVTQQKGRQLVRWANLSYAQKVEAVGALWPSNWLDGALADIRKAILAKNVGCPEIERLIYRIRDEVTRELLNLLGESPDPEN